MQFAAVLQFFIFQAVWWGIALSAQRDLDVMGWVVAIVYVIAYLLSIKSPLLRWQELRFVTSVAALGFAVDGVIAISGVVTYTKAFFIVPMWLFFMWLAFATTIKSSMQPFLKSTPIALVSGALFGPLSYEAGRALGLIEFHSAWGSRLVYAVCWMAFMYAFSRASVSRAQ